MCMNNVIEDGPHFLLECNLYGDLRGNLQDIITKAGLNNVPILEQYTHLMGSNDFQVQRILAKTAFNCFERRKLLV